MQWVLYGLAVIAGVLNTISVGANTVLARIIQIRFVAALAITTVSFIGLLLVGAVFGQLAWPGRDKISHVPWWGWIGGLLSIFYLMSQLLIAERIGAAAFMALTVTAAVVASVMLDHFGVLGFQPHPAGPLRLVGAAMMIFGVVLVAKY